MNKVLQISFIALATMLLYSGCSTDNRNVTVPSDWKNIKEDRYAIYDVTSYEENFIQNLEKTMKSLSPDKLNMSESRNENKNNKLKRYF